MSDHYTMSNVPKDNPEFKDLYLFHGKSAYQAAVEQGFEGTEREWILSLKDIVFGNISTFNENSNKHIYVDTLSNYIYRYDEASGKYQPIGGVLGETADTAYRGDRGKIAYDHSQSEHVALDHHHIPDEIDGLMEFINKSIIGEGAAPTNLNTIKKIADSLNDDPDFAGTVSADIDTALATAKAYADSVGSSTLASAKSFSNTNLASAKEYADQAEADALIAAKSYTDSAKNGLLGSAPTNLNTLDKLAAAIGDDASFATTVSNNIASCLASAKSYADTVSASALSSAKTYTDNTVANYLPLAGGKQITGNVSFSNVSLYPVTTKTGNLGTSSYYWNALYCVTGNFSGNVTASKVFNSVWNDYAEWFERSNVDETINPGDICTWNGNGVTKSCRGDINIVGVYSDSYGHILGGESLQNMDDNIKKYVPVGLAGRVKVKVEGKVKSGDYIIPSKIPGVGKAFNKKKYQFWKKLDIRCVVGKALESKDNNDISRVTVLIINS